VPEMAAPVGPATNPQTCGTESTTTATISDHRVRPFGTGVSRGQRGGHAGNRRYCGHKSEGISRGLVVAYRGNDGFWHL
jgi:hypothetical protein